MNTFSKALVFSLLGLGISTAACAEGWYAGLDLITSRQIWMAWRSKRMTPN
ncbi:hypothetical protein P5G63_09110 [Aeromonas salmonicida]|uniref:hypothetical protein n=1 Tax=Aeromonas salmonicida TaxID=645 RepID=UPI0023F1DBAC|nr:hypothetical protein [Aeromonas salmonicida]MDF8328651.1 hypothetical protein [Aeromonas salmonicida]